MRLTRPESGLTCARCGRRGLEGGLWVSMFDDCGIGWEGGDAVDGLFPMMRVFQHDLDVVFR